MANNNQLTCAKKTKNDEFYTKMDDISKELFMYKEQFENKVVFCNCDDPYESNFFKFFVLNFNKYKLKKLICTCYYSSSIIGQQLSLFDLNYDIKATSKKHAYKIVINYIKDVNDDSVIDSEDIEYMIKNDANIISILKGDGDFRSNECIKLLKESDIVVTNPPFSLWREYVAQLIEYKKQFLIIGNDNNVTYKDVFPYIMNNMMWFGYNHVKEFIIPGGGMKKFGNVCWYTNLDVKKRHDKLLLYKKYNEHDYPKYNNNNKIINVKNVIDIPIDFKGIMGVPISFMTNYNPEQFKIVGSINANVLPPDWNGLSKDFVDLYYKQGNTGTIREGIRLPGIIDKQGNTSIPFNRLFIQWIEEGENNEDN